MTKAAALKIAPQATGAACSPDRASATASSRTNLDPYQAKHHVKSAVVRRFVRDGIKMEVRRCKNCGGEFEWAADLPKDFGCQPCRAEFLKRRQARGLQIIDAAMRWRGDRSDPTAMPALCAMISEFIAQDRAAGRDSW